MSTVLIVGASRGIGLETVRLALKAGHSVRALARSATSIHLHDPRLEKLDSDALDRGTVELRWKAFTRSFRRLEYRQTRNTFSAGRTCFRRPLVSLWMRRRRRVLSA
jgi:NAD(P)-dependent dehydrogenase (short-subunit alcohol dehydrogenase family)